MVNLDRNIFEGWTIGDFAYYIEENTNFINLVNNDILKTKEDVKKYCRLNQPYTTKGANLTAQYLCQKYNIR